MATNRVGMVLKHMAWVGHYITDRDGPMIYVTEQFRLAKITYMMVESAYNVRDRDWPMRECK
jgi:hypothetical protein